MSERAAFVRRQGEVTAACGGRPWRLARSAAGACIALAAAGPAMAQYSFDPSRADEQTPGIRYFGSAKDDTGARLSGVSFVFDTGPAVYVFVTDDVGRFHGRLPLDTVAEKVVPVCRKAGFRLLRIAQRPSTRADKRTVQVDCVLQAEHAR